MPDLLDPGELGVEQRLPPQPVALAWRVVEDQEVAPEVRRVGRRADEQVPVATLDHASHGKDVQIGCQPERPGHRGGVVAGRHDGKTRRRRYSVRRLASQCRSRLSISPEL